MIKIYTTPTCIYCHALMDWLDELGVSYEEINAENDPEIKSVPVTVFIDKSGAETRVSGFNRPKIKKLLALENNR